MKVIDQICVYRSDPIENYGFEHFGKNVNFIYFLTWIILYLADLSSYRYRFLKNKFQDIFITARIL
jgi:hypothetical protein